MKIFALLNCIFQIISINNSRLPVTFAETIFKILPDFPSFTSFSQVTETPRNIILLLLKNLITQHVQSLQR